jgi:anti-sigma factor RsiW
MSGPADWTETAARHERVTPLLGAYADDEINAEVRRAVETHLSECAECAQELRVQLALGNRLRTEQVAEEPSASVERLRNHVAGLGRTAAGSGKHAPPKMRAILGHPVAWSGWLIAASLALVLFTSRRQAAGPAMGMSMGPLVPVSVDSVPEPVAEAALHDFLRVTQAALPQGPELKAVQAEVPFSVPALRAPHMRLIGAWTTTIDHVPAAVLAYRCHDRLVVQYVVPEHVFFRQPRVRHAVAQSGLYAAGEGKIHTIGWPGSDNGSFLVGEFTASELAAMRM